MDKIALHSLPLILLTAFCFVMLTNRVYVLTNYNGSKTNPPNPSKLLPRLSTSFHAPSSLQQLTFPTLYRFKSCTMDTFQPLVLRAKRTPHSTPAHFDLLGLATSAWKTLLPQPYELYSVYRNSQNTSILIPPTYYAIAPAPRRGLPYALHLGSNRPSWQLYCFFSCTTKTFHPLYAEPSAHFTEPHLLAPIPLPLVPNAQSPALCTSGQLRSPMKPCLLWPARLAYNSLEENYNQKSQFMSCSSNYAAVQIQDGI